MNKLKTFNYVVFILTISIISCKSTPQITMNKNFQLINNCNFLILPNFDKNNDFYQNSETIIKSILKQKNYNISDINSDKKQLLLLFSSLYKYNNMKASDIKEISNIIEIQQGYLIISSLDKVEVQKYEITNDDFDQSGFSMSSSTTSYYTEISIKGRLSIYDISNGEEVFKATHKISREKQDKVESSSSDPIGCLLGAITDSIMNDKLSEETFNSFSQKVINEYYSDIIKRIPK